MEAITSGVNEREELIHFSLQLLKGLKRSPFEVSFEMFPQALNGIEFWTVRGLKQQDDIFWDNQIFALVESSVINLKKVKAIWISYRELI